MYISNAQTARLVLQKFTRAKSSSCQMAGMFFCWKKQIAKARYKYVIPLFRLSYTKNIAENDVFLTQEKFGLSFSGAVKVYGHKVFTFYEVAGLLFCRHKKKQKKQQLPIVFVWILSHYIWSKIQTNQVNLRLAVLSRKNCKYLT